MDPLEIRGLVLGTLKETVLEHLLIDVILVAEALDERIEGGVICDNDEDDFPELEDLFSSWDEPLVNSILLCGYSKAVFNCGSFEYFESRSPDVCL